MCMLFIRGYFRRMIMTELKGMNKYFSQKHYCALFMKAAPVVLMLIFLSACSSETKDRIVDDFNLSLHDLPAQDAQERHVADNLESYASINLGGYDIFIPELISISEEGAIGIFDYSRMQFNLIVPEEDFSGSTHSVLPIRSGRGPGEFQNPVEVLFTADNELLLADPANAKLIYYTPEGELMGEHNLSERPHRMAKTNDRIVFAYIMEEKLFGTLNFETMEKAGSFGSIPTTAPILKQGDLAARGDKVVFMPYGSSWFALFTDQGELLYQVSTVQPVMQSGNVLKQLQDLPTIRPQEFRFINSSVQLLDEVIVILYSGDNSGNIANMIDIYSVTDGTYVGSFTLDAPANLIRIRGNTLYTRSRNSDGDFVINIYDFQPRKLLATNSN